MHPALTGDDLRALRRGVGLSQRSVARKMFCSLPQVKRWEGENPFMPDSMVPIFLDAIMAAMAERDEMLHLVLIVRQKVLRKRTDDDPASDPKPSSSVG